MLLKRLDELHEAAAEAGRHLATARVVPAEVGRVVAEVSEAREATPETELAAVDPYLVLALDRGLLGAWRALRDGADAARRDAVRVAVEQIRQALRDLGDDAPVADTRPAKDVARWLGEVLDASQADVAALLGVSPRQYQRWVSASDPAEPRGADAHRLRAVARLVAHLRHAWTGPGVVAWLTAPHPALEGHAPVSLLDDPDQLPRLRGLAASTRSTRAA
jgi:hypothetical protein